MNPTKKGDSAVVPDTDLGVHVRGFVMHSKEDTREALLRVDIYPLPNNRAMLEKLLAHVNNAAREFLGKEEIIDPDMPMVDLLGMPKGTQKQ